MKIFVLVFGQKLNICVTLPPHHQQHDRHHYPDYHPNHHHHHLIYVELYLVLHISWWCLSPPPMRLCEEYTPGWDNPREPGNQVPRKS